MKRHRKIFWALTLAWGYWILVARLNDALTPYSIYLWAPAPFVLFTTLFLDFPINLGALLVYGALVEAAIPLPFGRLSLLFMATYGALIGLKLHLRVFSPANLWVLAQITNCLLFIITCGLAYSTTTPFIDYAARLLGDLAASQLFLGLTSHWLFALYSQVTHKGIL